MAHDRGNVGQCFDLAGVMGVVGTNDNGRDGVGGVLAVVFFFKVAVVTGDEQQPAVIGPIRNEAAQHRVEHFQMAGSVGQRAPMP